MLASIVERLSREHERAVGGRWELQRERQAHMSQLAGIIGFAFVPDRIEMTFKLSQNHPPANVNGAARGLKALGSPMAAEVAGLMLDRLSRRTQA